MGDVEKRPCWLIEGPSKGRKKEAKSEEEREIRYSLLILDLKDGKLQDSVGCVEKRPWWLIESPSKGRKK